MKIIYGKLYWAASRLFSKMGKLLCRVWPWGAIRLSKVAMALYMQAVKICKKE